jgi:XTP/dITP diphosphohydrolase
MQKLVIASNNPGKLREFQFLLQPLGIEVLTQAQLNIEEAEESHHTFIENALAKARHVSRLSGLPALADDSGICVTALDGAPGVLSERYAGDNPKSDERNNEKLLQVMRGVHQGQPRYTRLTANSLNSAVYSGFGIFFIIFLSKVTLFLRHPWMTIFREKLICP